MRASDAPSSGGIDLSAAVASDAAREARPRRFEVPQLVLHPVRRTKRSLPRVAEISSKQADDELPMLVLASLLIFEQSLLTLCVSGSIWKRLIHLAPYARDVLWCLLVMWRVWCIRGKNAPNIQI